MCSLSTRGFWFEILGAMHELGRSGQITGTAQQLARVGRCTAAEAEEAVAELKSTRAAEVSERNGSFTLINRRMKREYDEREGSKRRVANYRKNKNVTNGNENVTDAQTTVIVEENGVKRESNENVTPYSSSSISKELPSGGGSSYAREGGKPPAADNSPPTKKQAESEKARLEKYLEQKQAEFQQFDVRKIYEDFAKKCGSAKYPNLKNTPRSFDKWLSEQEVEFTLPDSFISAKPAWAAAIEACQFCNEKGLRQTGGDGRLVPCNHTKEK